MLRRILPALLCLLLLAGCAGRRPLPPTDDSDVRDVLTLPQNASAYLNPLTADLPLVPDGVQAAAARRFAAAWFAPWNATAPRHAKDDALWGLRAFAAGSAWGYNHRKVPAAELDAIKANADPDSFPNLVQPGIAVRDLDLRVLPTDEPLFQDFAKAGQGLPFDLNQNSRAWDQTPLLVAHVSADKAWYLVETPTAAGWVPSRDVALCDPGFIRLFATLRLAAVTWDRTPVADPYGRFRLLARLGMVLPLIGGDRDGLDVLLADRDLHGSAAPLFTRLAPDAATPLPQPLTARNVAGLADQLLGQPYGWGGVWGGRDCSSTLQDLFTPFGLLLPRNSAAQAKAGKGEDLSGLADAAKEATILAHGVPFLSLLHRPGHILLYLGERDGRAVAMHTVWGVRTTDFSGPTPGRKVIGRTVVTTLVPGRELSRFDPEGSLLKGIDRLTLPLAPVD
jgi:hypothetical protein